MPDKEETLLKIITDQCYKEDRSVRERQIRSWRRLKMFWENLQRIYYSEIAHDWRIWDREYDESADQSYYDKPVNIFRAYLESIIAALSINIPSIICYPDNAEDPLDLQTARVGTKIAKLIYRHNDAPLLWLKALFTYCTEGMVACYSYSKEDEKFGTYEENKYETEEEIQDIFRCPSCGMRINDNFCPDCGEVIPMHDQESISIQRIVGKTIKPKSRQILEVYGGLYVKVPIYAKKQEDCHYLIFSYETHYANAIERYRHLSSVIREKMKVTHPSDTYEYLGRLSPQYQGVTPENNVTVKNVWLRPAAFNMLDDDDCEYLRDKFPNGVKVVLVNDEFAEAVPESLDDHWTLTYNPLSDHIYHDPIGLLLVSLQEITNDFISLTLQTIEHGIPQTFANPAVLNFDQYRQMEALPGAIFPATPRGGRALGEDFYEVKTAHLSPEVLPFFERIQNLAQLVSGALPTLFGGALQGTKTASEYSMSRAQALQRLQNIWRIFTSWWREIFRKVIIAYINDIKDDERFVERDKFGNFVNVLIRKSELEGRIGDIELESSEFLPITWGQQKDTVLQLLQSPHPKIMEVLASPENLPILKQAIGIPEFHVPGEMDREKQYEEIKLLVNSQPIFLDDSPESEAPSVEVDPMDNHLVEFATCRAWIVSDAGRMAKAENPFGYRNVLLHAKQHMNFLQQQGQTQPTEEASREEANAKR